MCKTSNPGSNDLLALDQGSSTTLYETIAKLAGQWSFQHKASLGLVVGATDSIALSRARKAGGESVWILAPGVGAQGGDLELALASGLNSNGTGMLIPVSRGISRADNPGEAAKELQEKINAARSMQTNAVCKRNKGFNSGIPKGFFGVCVGRRCPQIWLLCAKEWTNVSLLFQRRALCVWCCLTQAWKGICFGHYGISRLVSRL